jgi:hypothetical protein
MYGEDIDLSYRIQKAGFKNYYLSESTIIHFKGESTNKTTIKHLQNFYGAMHLFVKKHYGFISSALLYLFIKLIIFVKLIFTVCCNFFTKPVNLKYINEEKKRLIVADESVYNDTIQLLKQAEIRLNITTRLDITAAEKTTALGNLESLPASVKRYAITEIIFCEKSLSFKEIISTAEKFSSLKIDYMFHASGSSSIVGSNNKNANGISIAAK